MVRAATAADVDHIALCVFLKSIDSDEEILCMLEAVNNGVQLMPWNVRRGSIGKREHYNYALWRRLNYDFDDEKRQLLN